MPADPNILVRPVEPRDHAWVVELLNRNWVSARIVNGGRVHRADELPGFIAARAGAPVGLATYHIEAGDCELVTLNSLGEGEGVGSRLIAQVERTAVHNGCRRLWLVTTNDNTQAQRFYENRGFAVVAVHKGAVTEARKLKPEIPETGMNGVPITDEVEMEMVL